MQRLKVAMADEGYPFSTHELEGVLKFLSSLSLGTLERGKNGKVLALKGVKYTLQSIGLAAVADNQPLKKLHMTNRFITLPPQKPDSNSVFASAAIPAPTALPPRADKATRQYEASLMVTIDGEEIRFKLPNKITMEQVTKILAGI